MLCLAAGAVVRWAGLGWAVSAVPLGIECQCEVLSTIALAIGRAAGQQSCGGLVALGSVSVTRSAAAGCSGQRQQVVCEGWGFYWPAEVAVLAVVSFISLQERKGALLEPPCWSPLAGAPLLEPPCKSLIIGSHELMSLGVQRCVSVVLLHSMRLYNHASLTRWLSEQHSTAQHSTAQHSILYFLS